MQLKNDLSSQLFIQKICIAQGLNPKNFMELFNKYQGMLKTCDQLLISKEEIEQLDFLFKSYEQDCLKFSSPQVSENLELKMLPFEKAYVFLIQDEQCTWIDNFFIQWATAGRLRDDETLTLLYSSLHAPLMQIKYLVDDDFLMQQFPQTATKPHITSYLINRLFLHAIMVHPKEWTPSFFNYFSAAFVLVFNELSEKKQNFLAQALIKDSYPNVLMRQFQYLQDCYQYFQGNSLKEPDIIAFYIPMKQFVRTIRQFEMVVEYLSEMQQAALIGTLSHDFLKAIIKNHNDLRRVIKFLSEAQTTAFIEAWDNKFLMSMINIRDDWSSVIILLSDMQILTFIKVLDGRLLRKMINNSYDLHFLIRSFSETQKMVFIETLDHDFLKGMIKCNIDLIFMIKYLSETQKTAFIKTWDNNFIKAIIKNGDDLNQVIGLLSENQILVFIEALGNDVLKTIIKTDDELSLVTEQLSDTQKIAFKKAWDNEKVTRSFHSGFFSPTQANVTQHGDMTENSSRCLSSSKK